MKDGGTIIGPEKALDTRKFFVLSANYLGVVMANRTASINPERAPFGGLRSPFCG